MIFLFLLPFSVSADLQTNLISYWSLDDANDAHGSNDLTNNNTVTFIGGKVGNAGEFETSSEMSLSIADGSQTGLDFTGDFTFNGWADPEDAGGGAHALIGKFRTPGNIHSYNFKQNLNQSPPVFRLELYNGSGSTADFKFEGISNDVYYMWTISYDASAGTAKFYFNASTSASMEATGLITSIQKQYI